LSFNMTGSTGAPSRRRSWWPITSNLRLGAMPGNVRLSRGEAGLPHASVVNISQVRTIDRSLLEDRVGALGAARLREVLRGIALLFGTEAGSGHGS
jgi:mRNA-degrading endonuclease toxin of MazEF toxin-antitoxin module